MKISTNWIKELIPGLELSGKEIAELLTKHSFETVVEREYAIDSNILIAKIVRLEKHPDADRLRLATITDGTQEIRVVCGAPNISEGDVVPYSPPGTHVYDENGELFMLSVAKIRGVESPGMLNSARELGLSNDHGGIFLFPKDTPLGTKLADYIAGDVLLEVDVLPDRAHDCMSHIGIAREVAALTKLSVQEPELAVLPEAVPEVQGWSVQVEHAEDAVRFVGVGMSGVRADAATPIAMQARLLALGARPIHPVVDCTNYVMFEYGQPSHAYDQAKLSGKTISVTEAQGKQVFSALNGKEYTSEAGDILIQSGESIIGLAGIIGGTSSQVDETTKDIIVEAATFNAFKIQQTALRIALRTEASSRFSKSISPVVAGIAASRLAHLIAALTGASVQGVLDTHPVVAMPQPITFRPSRASQFAGVEISADDAEDALTRLGFSIEKSSEDVWGVIAPAQRLDITGEHDVIDEVVRMYGLDRIVESSIVETFQPLAVSESVHWEQVVRHTLVELGFTETYSYSFENERMAKLLHAEMHPHVELVNPMAPELKKLRYSMVPGLMAAMVTSRDEMHREKTGQERALFEIGRVYHTGDTGVVPGVVERRVIAGITVGGADAVQNTIDALCEVFSIASVDVEDVAKPFGIYKKYSYAGEFLAVGYVFNADVLKKMKYHMPVAAFEVSVAALLKHAPDVDIPAHSLADIRALFQQPNQFTELPKYPSVFRDISVLVDSSVAIDAVAQEINRVGGDLVVDVDLFDEYSPSADAPRGLAFHIEYRSQDKTLTDSEITEIHKKIEHTLKKQFNAEVR